MTDTVTMLTMLVPALLGMACTGDSAAPPWPGRTFDFHSFTGYDFTRNGLVCKVVVPETTVAGTPWVWRARFFGAEPQTDIALLKKGFHVAYVDVENLFGAPAAVDRWNRFYRFMVQERGFHPKPVIEAFSRGGLIAYNWAAENPDKVSCIYADAPVCDIKSWPLGTGSGAGWPEGVETCLQAYGLTYDQALVYDKNPVDRLALLAAAGVPLLHVVGDADTAVPVAENTAVTEERYQALGGRIKIIHKPDCGHHPHSLPDPTPIVDFILRHAAPDSTNGSL